MEIDICSYFNVDIKQETSLSGFGLDVFSDKIEWINTALKILAYFPKLNLYIGALRCLCFYSDKQLKTNMYANEQIIRGVIEIFSIVPFPLLIGFDLAWTAFKLSDKNPEIYNKLKNRITVFFSPAIVESNS